MRVNSTQHYFLDFFCSLWDTNPFANRTCNLPNGTKNKDTLKSHLLDVFQRCHQRWAHQATHLWCICWGPNVKERRTQVAGNRHQGLRSRVTCYRILLTTAAQTRPLAPEAARGRPTSPEGPRPRTPPRDGACRGTPGAFPPEASGGGLRNLRGRTRAVTKAREGCSPRPLAAGEPGPADTASQGRPSRSPGRRQGARRPPSPRPAPARPARSPPAGRAGGARACPTALFLIQAELAAGPSPPARPPRPEGRSPNVSRPAQPAVSSGPHPPRRVSDSSATLRARRSSPRACAPPRREPQAAPAAGSPLPQPTPPSPAARAHRGDLGRRGPGRLRIGRERRVSVGPGRVERRAIDPVAKQPGLTCKEGVGSESHKSPRLQVSVLVSFSC